MTEPKSIPVPSALRELIVISNELLEKYQAELTERVATCNKEMMQLLNLNPEDGWRLDTRSMTYVQQELPNNDTPVS